MWTVAADGLSVYQSINSQPSVYFSPLPAIGSFLEGTIKVESPGNWDDDWIGFVLGFQAGDSLNPDSDFLLVDWKQQDQSGALRGLAVSRVHGANGDEFWAHTDSPTNGTGTGVFEIARAATLSRTGWADNREYRFRFEIAPDRLQIWVDGVQQFDLPVTVPTGKFGFYNYSQEAVRYRGFSTGLQQRFEGETFELTAPFTDAGVLDLHTATVAWDDGASSEADAATEEGFGVVTASHTYADDGDFLIEACVEDDAGARGCGIFPLLVLNLPPVITAAADASGVAEASELFALATFTDPGTLDSHQATVDWGDGTVEEAEVEEDAGTGSVAATHTYDLPGSYPVAVCVTDDDGATACTALVLTIASSPPLLSAEKTATVIDRDGDGRASPGDDIVYRIEVFDDALEPATAVRLVDPVPAYTTLVPGSIFPEAGVVATDPVTVDLDPIDATSSVIVQFAVTIASPLPAGVTAIVNSGIVQSAEAPPVPTDDPALPGTSDPTRTPVFVSPDLTATKRATPIDLDGDGVASPGDEIAWTIEVQASGDSPARGVLVQDAIGPHLALVPGTLAAPGAHLLSISPLAVVYDEIPVGGTVEIAFRTTIDPALPAEVETVANQATVLATDVDSFLSDDPDTPVAADPTVVPVYVDPTISIAGLVLPEGNVGLTPVVFPVTLDRPARLATTVEWTVEGITATAGEDFVAASGTLTIPVGSSSGEIVVQAVGDLVVENDELLRVVLTSPVHAQLGTAEALATLLNDDAVELSIEGASVVEGDGGAAGDSELLFRLALSTVTFEAVEADLATVAESATEGVDFTAVSGHFTIPAGATELWVAVPVLGDLLVEGDETLRVVLSNVTGATLAVAEATGTIVDDDEEASGCLGPNLLHNGGAEEATAGCEVPGWSEVSGDWWVQRLPADPLPAEGESHFVGRAGDDDGEGGGGGGATVATVATAATTCGIRPLAQLAPAAPVAQVISGASGDSCEGDDDDGEHEPHGDRAPALFAFDGGGGSGGDDGGGGHGGGGGGGDDDGCHGDDDLTLMNGGHGGGGGDDEEACVAELAQSVDVAPFAARIDAGEQSFDFRGAFRTELGENPARVRIEVEYLAASGSTPLEAFDTGWVWSDGVWETVEDTRPGARRHPADPRAPVRRWWRGRGPRALRRPRAPADRHHRALGPRSLRVRRPERPARCPGADRRHLPGRLPDRPDLRHGERDGARAGRLLGAQRVAHAAASGDRRDGAGADRRRHGGRAGRELRAALRRRRSR